MEVVRKDTTLDVFLPVELAGLPDCLVKIGRKEAAVGSE